MRIQKIILFVQAKAVQGLLLQQLISDSEETSRTKKSTCRAGIADSQKQQGMQKIQSKLLEGASQHSLNEQGVGRR